jgi:cytochrome P450
VDAKTAIGLNEALFANAAQFNPSRFAAGPGGERPAESIATAMPFGAGVRHCIGATRPSTCARTS